MVAVYSGIAAIGACLQVWVVHLLLRRWARSLPVLTAAAVFALLSTVVSSAAIVGLWRWTKETAVYYWSCEGISQLLMLLAMLELLWKAQGGDSREAADMRQRWRVLGRTAFIGSILFLVAVGAPYDVHISRWMTGAVRNLSFSSMILCFLVWTALLRRPNTMLLLLCAGIGIPLAGSAIGHGLRTLTPSMVPAGNLVLTLTYLAGQYIWVRALTPTTAKAPVEKAAAVAPAKAAW